MRILAALCLSVLSLTALAEIKTQEVSYLGGGVTMRGLLAWDGAVKGKRPGVLVVHEWWGHNDYARMRAQMLAELGYVALAVDMYGDGKSADHPDTAKAFMQEATKDTGQLIARFRAAEARLKAAPQTDAKRVAAIGYCFGGAVVLNMARLGEPLKGVASFHGNLVPWVPAAKGSVKARVLVLHGADDNMIPAEAVTAFEQEMKAAGASFRVISYPGAKHSFTNPMADTYARQFNMPIAYNAAADQASWQELVRFFQQIFR